MPAVLTGGGGGVGVRMPRFVWAIERKTGVVDGDEEFGRLVTVP